MPADVFNVVMIAELIMAFLLLLTLDFLSRSGKKNKTNKYGKTALLFKKPRKSKRK